MSKEVLQQFLPYIAPSMFVAVVLYMFLIYERYYTVSKKLKAVTYKKEVPDQLPSPELGTLRDGKVHQRDLTACIVALAQKGYINIEQQKTSRFWHRGIYLLHLTQPFEFDTYLNDYERTILDCLFKKNQSIHIKDLGNAFQGRLKVIEAQIVNALLDKSYIDHFPYIYKKRSIYFLIFYILFFLLLGFNLSSLTILYWFCFISTTMLLIIKTLHYIPYTKKGLMTKHKILSYESFLKSMDVCSLSNQEIKENVSYCIALDVLDDFVNTCKSSKMFKKPQWFLTQQEIDASTFFSNLSSFIHSFQTSVFGKSNKVKSISSQVLKEGFSEDEFSND